MININDADLETALRSLAAQSGHTISSISRALMRIGMRAEPAAITAEIVSLRRPMGRPPALPPEKPARQETAREVIARKYGKKR